MVILVCMASIAVHGQADEETFDRITVANGLSSTVVTCILKDSKGFMWFGTQNGLSKYDGYTFTIYRHADTVPHSISGNYILSLFEDNRGYIWIGTENNGLNRYDRVKDRFTLFAANAESPGNISDNSVRVVRQNADGILFFGTNKGVNQYDPGTGQFSQLHFSGSVTGTDQLPVYELLMDTDGSLWIGTSAGLFHHILSTGATKVYTHDPADENTLSNSFINSIIRMRNGSLYIGTNLGLNIFNPENESFIRYYYNPESTFSEAKSEVQALAEDQRGNLWIGSFGGGLVKIDGSTEKSSIYINDASLETSISNDYIYSLFFDDSGILWIGTYGGGINKIDLMKIRFDHIAADNSDPNSLPGNDVYSILPLEDEVWFGTDKGLARWDLPSNTFHRMGAGSTTPTPFRGSAVYCLLEDSERNLWLGTAGKGLNKLAAESRDNKTFEFTRLAEMDAEGELMSDEILCLHEDQDHTLWAGTLDGIFLVRGDSVVATFSNDLKDSTSLSDNEVYAIHTDRQGRTWIGTFMGLSRFNPEDSSFTHYENLLGKDETINSVYSIYQDTRGMLWVGTDNSGLIKIDPERGKMIRQYTKKDKLPDNVIYGILEDEEQNLWLSSNNGIAKAIRQAGSDNLTFIHYSTENWLKTDAFNIGAYARGDEGTLYFGSFEGVTYFHPDNVKGNINVPPVYITNFRLFFEPVGISEDNSTPLSAHISETQAIRLKHNQNVLTFGFAALNYIGTNNNRYAFRMEGLEERWNYVENREAQYMYIPPGEYVFRVKASNNNGIWNETGTAIAIIITPPFTQTLWFYIIVGSGGVILFFWIMNLRTRRLKAARSRLEKQVQSRTQELRETNLSLEAEIQERKKVQDALAKSEARYRQLIETMNEGFSVQDRDGRINYVNPKLCEMFGMSQKEIIGKYPVDFIDDSSPEYRERFNSYRDQSISKGKVGSYEMNWKRKDGSIFVAMVSPKPIFSEENRYSGSVAVLTDITDLKKAEKLLIDKNKDLNTALDDLKKTQAQLIDSEKMASLGQLTAGVAHEINNPINFVSGNVQPLRRDISDILEVLGQYDTIIEKLNLDDDFKAVEEFKKTIDFDFVLSEINNLLDGIGEGASRTAEIVKGLRNFSRMDEHELKLASINQGIDSTLLILHNKIKTRIEVIREYGDFPDIMCHPGQLNQVFLNLLNNAQEAIEKEGTIVIRTWKANHFVKISIKDDGKGIPAKSIKKIFDPFYTTKDVGKGTGLGLSISFGIVEKHNGSIEVHSEPGKGTEFIVSIPDNLN